MGGHGYRVVWKARLQQKVDHALATFLGAEGIGGLSHLLGTGDPQFNVVAARFVEKLGDGVEIVAHRGRGRTGPFCHLAIGDGLRAALAKQSGRSQHQRGSRDLSFQGFGLGQRLSHGRLASFLITFA